MVTMTASSTGSMGASPAAAIPCTHKGHCRDYQPAETTAKGAGSGDDGTKRGTEAPA